MCCINQGLDHPRMGQNSRMASSKSCSTNGLRGSIGKAFQKRKGRCYLVVLVNSLSCWIISSEFLVRVFFNFGYCHFLRVSMCHARQNLPDHGPAVQTAYSACHSEFRHIRGEFLLSLYIYIANNV